MKKYKWKLDDQHNIRKYTNLKKAINRAKCIDIRFKAKRSYDKKTKSYMYGDSRTGIWITKIKRKRK